MVGGGLAVAVATMGGRGPKRASVKNHTYLPPFSFLSLFRTLAQELDAISMEASSDDGEGSGRDGGKHQEEEALSMRLVSTPLLTHALARQDKQPLGERGGAARQQEDEERGAVFALDALPARPRQPRCIDAAHGLYH